MRQLCGKTAATMRQLSGFGAAICGFVRQICVILRNLCDKIAAIVRQQSKIIGHFLLHERHNGGSLGGFFAVLCDILAALWGSLRLFVALWQHNGSKWQQNDNTMAAKFGGSAAVLRQSLAVLGAHATALCFSSICFHYGGWLVVGWCWLVAGGWWLMAGDGW
jgi:hypothetical protein